MEEKEIIGYKFKEGCEQYREAAERIAIFTASTNQKIEYYLEKRCWGRMRERLEEAGVLELWFEPVYKEEEFKLNRWYKNGDAVFYATSTEGNRIKGYGINLSGNWSDNLYISKHDDYINKCILATEEEVKEALIKEARKRGFVDGARFNSVKGDNFLTQMDNQKVENVSFYIYRNALCTRYGVIFCNGEWAEIVKDELPEINGYKGELNTAFNTVKYGCAVMYIEDLKNIVSFGVDFSSRTISKVTLSSGVEITVEQIKQILKAYENRNI